MKLCEKFFQKNIYRVKLVEPNLSEQMQELFLKFHSENLSATQESSDKRVVGSKFSSCSSLWSIMWLREDPIMIMRKLTLRRE